jgi:hypothetical protein
MVSTEENITGETLRSDEGEGEGEGEGEREIDNNS